MKRSGSSSAGRFTPTQNSGIVAAEWECWQDWEGKWEPGAGMGAGHSRSGGLAPVLSVWQVLMYVTRCRGPHHCRHIEREDRESGGDFYLRLMI